MLGFFKKIMYRRYLLRVILVTAALILLPIAVISMLFVNALSAVTERSLSGSALDSVEIASNNLNAHIMTIEQLPYTLSADKTITEFLFKPYYPLDANDVRRVLQMYILTNSIVDNIMVQGESHVYICSADGIFPAGRSVLTPEIDGQPVTVLFSGGGAHLQPYMQRKYDSSEPSKVLACTRKVFFADYKFTRNMVIILDYQKIRNVINASGRRSAGTVKNTALLAPDGRFVTELDNYNGISLEDILAQCEIGDRSGIEEVSFGGSDYVVAYSSGPGRGGYYLASVIPRQEMVEGISEAINAYVGTLALILVLLAAVAALVAKINYNPIRELLNVSETALRYIEQNTESDEVGRIKTIMANLIAHIDTLSDKLEDSREAVMDNLIRNLINDPHNAKTETALGELGIGLSYPSFTVALASVRDSEGRREELEAFVRRGQIGGVVILTARPVGNDGPLIFVLNHDLYQERLRALFLDIKTGWESERNPGLTVGVGGIYRDISQIGMSYIEAKNAMDYQLILGERVITAWEIQAYNNSSGIPIRRLDSFGDLYQAVVNADQQKISGILTALSRYISEQHISIIEAKCLCYELISSVMKAVDELASRDSLPESNVDIVKLGQFNTVNELIDMISGIGASLDRLLNSAGLPATERSIEAVNEYIERNFTDPDFSVQLVSERFGMSLSSFSQYFKQKTGKTAINYIAELRIERAKRLLEDTNLSINDIVHHVGYFSTSSFIKKFRQLESCTPSEYRDLCRARERR